MRKVILCALFVSAACGSSPTAPLSTVSTVPSPSPSPPPTPPTAPAATSFHVTGIVTDESGTAVDGLPLHFEFAAGDFASVPELPCNSYCTISTDATGGYELSFKALPSSFYGSPTVAGLIHTWRPGYQTNVQLLPLRPDIVQHIRLRRTRVIPAGESFNAVIEPDSSMCADMEDWFVWTHRCDAVVIAAQTTGTLVVDGREGAGGAPLPYIFFPSSGGNFTTIQNVGTGVVSVGVRAGERYAVFVGAPVHVPPALRYEVKTFIAEAP